MVRVLEGRKAIAAYLGLHDVRSVRSLWRAGAPIRVTGRGPGRRYYADPAALRSWLQCAET